MPPAGWSALKPQKIKTWVRIRPLASEGGGGGKPVDGHTDGKPVEKQLGAFDEKSVKIIHHDQRSKEQAYDYPSRVFPVDCSQEDVGKDVLPGLLDDFWNDRSGVIFAYGQTGTGKTTTMFGFPESLTSESEHPGWGLLPRAVHATLERMAVRAARSAGVQVVWAQVAELGHERLRWFWVSRQKPSKSGMRSTFFTYHS